MAACGRRFHGKVSGNRASDQLEAIGEAAEALWDATLRFQDQLDELESERSSRWTAYAAFREIGAVFRFALERLQMEQPLDELDEIISTYRAGARAGFEAAADLAEAVRDDEVESIDMGVQRVTIASQHFVRGRYLLNEYLNKQGDDGLNLDKA
jgi:hypothetical protein